MTFIFENRHGHEKFSGVSGGVIKIYVLQLVLYLCSQKEKKITSIFTKKKVVTLFLKSWYSMTIESNSMILRHEIVPVYKIFPLFFV